MNDGLPCEEQDREQSGERSSLSILSTSIADSKAGSDPHPVYMNPILIDHLLSKVSLCVERMNFQYHIPPLRVAIPASRQQPVHKFTSQQSRVAMIAGIIPQAKTKEFRGKIKRRKQATKGNCTVMTTRRALRYLSRRKGVDLPLGRSFLWRKLKRGLSQTVRHKQRRACRFMPHLKSFIRLLSSFDSPWEKAKFRWCVEGRQREAEVALTC